MVKNIYRTAYFDSKISVFVKSIRPRLKARLNA